MDSMWYEVLHIGWQMNALTRCHEFQLSGFGNHVNRSKIQDFRMFKMIIYLRACLESRDRSEKV